MSYSLKWMRGKIKRIEKRPLVKQIVHLNLSLQAHNLYVLFLSMGLQGGVALLEGGGAAHISGLVAQLEPLHALGAGAVGEALGLCITL